MSKIKGLDRLQTSSLDKVVRHPIRGYHEVAYSFECANNSYLLLAGTIFGMLSSGTLIKLFCECSEGNLIEIEQVRDAYAAYVSGECLYDYAVGVFEGIPWVYKFPESIVRPVFDDHQKEMIMQLFFGSKEISFETMNKFLLLENSVYQMTGGLDESVSKTEVFERIMQAKHYSLIQSELYLTLQHNGIPLISGIHQADCFLTGILISDATTSFYIDYETQLAVPVYYHANTFRVGDQLHIIHGNVLLTLMIDKRYDITGTKLFLKNGSMIECANSPDGMVFHVPDFERLDDENQVIPWEGQTYSIQEIHDKGLDYDVQSGYTKSSNEEMSDNTVNSDDSEFHKLYNPAIEATYDNEINKSLSNELFMDLTKQFRDPEIDKLYVILNGKSLT